MERDLIVDVWARELGEVPRLVHCTGRLLLLAKPVSPASGSDQLAKPVAPASGSDLLAKPGSTSGNGLLVSYLAPVALSRGDVRCLLGLRRAVFATVTPSADGYQIDCRLYERGEPLPATFQLVASHGVTRCFCDEAVAELLTGAAPA